MSIAIQGTPLDKARELPSSPASGVPLEVDGGKRLGRSRVSVAMIDGHEMPAKRQLRFTQPLAVRCADRRSREGQLS